MKRKGRWVGALAILLIGLLWLWRGRNGDDARPAAQAPHDVVAPESARSVPSLPAATSTNTGPPPTTAPPFRIEDVTLDKAVVCRGEQVLVGVHAANDRGEAGWLVPVIDGQRGWVATVRPQGPAGMFKIPILLTDGATRPSSEVADEVTRTVEVELQDCAPPLTLFLIAKMEGSDEEYRFTAKVDKLSPGGKGPAPARFVWTFDDGTTESATTAEVLHRFPSEAERPRDRGLVSYVVTVEARDAKDAVLGVGKAAVTIPNRNAELLKRYGTLQLLASYDRAPVWPDATGQSRMAVTLRNLDDKDIANIDKVELTLLPCQAGGQVRKETVDAASIFPQPAVAPRSELTGQLRFQQDGRGMVCSVDVRLTGTSEPGQHHVEAAFSMRTGASDSMLATSKAIPTEALAILNKLRALGKTNVSHEDLRKLANEGVLTKAEVDTLIRGMPKTDP